MSDTTPYTPNQPPALKQRHGCLTAYLVFMIIANSATGLVYLLASEAIRTAMPNMPVWASPVLIVGGDPEPDFCHRLAQMEEMGIFGDLSSPPWLFFSSMSPSG